MAWYGEDGTKGTIAATNGSTAIVGSGTNWLTNKAAPGDVGGYGILAPLNSDFRLYSIDAISADGAMTIGRNFEGATASGLTYAIVPIDGPTVELLNDVQTLLNSSAFSQLNSAVGAAANGDFFQKLGGIITNRTTIQTIFALLSGITEVNVASASTCDIGNQVSPKAAITGTTGPITSLGTTASAFRFGRVVSTPTFNHSSTLLINNGGSNYTATADDRYIAWSDASATPVWRICFFRASGLPVSTAFTTLTVTSNSLTGIKVGAGGNGYVMVGNGTSSTEDAATFGVVYGQAGPFMGYGIKSLVAGYVSSYESSLARGVIDITSSGISLKFGSTQAVAIGSVVTMPEIALLTGAGLLAGADNTLTLGSASRRWSVVYAGTGSINTSDEREKSWIGELSDNEFAAGKAIYSELGGFKFLESIASKGEAAARIHFGVRAQRVRDILLAHALPAEKYAFLCFDEWEAQPAIAPTPEQPALPEIRNVEGEITQEAREFCAASPGSPAVPAGDRWGIRYDELTMFLLAVMDRRLSALEAG
jgi:hypothetical protein